MRSTGPLIAAGASIGWILATIRLARRNYWPVRVFVASLLLGVMPLVIAVAPRIARVGGWRDATAASLLGVTAVLALNANFSLARTYRATRFAEFAVLAHAVSSAPPIAPEGMVLIPAHNEESSLGQTLRELRALQLAIVVIDDGSSDSTARIALAEGASVVISLPFNMGVGAAVRCGLMYAARHGLPFAIRADADGQHSVEALSQVLAAKGSADLIVGYRSNQDFNYTKRLAIRTLRYLLQRRGIESADPTSGLHLFGTKAIDVFSARMPAEFFGDTVTALSIAADSGLKIAQVAVVGRPRIAGEAGGRGARAALLVLRTAVQFVFGLNDFAKHRIPRS